MDRVVDGHADQLTGSQPTAADNSSALHRLGRPEALGRVVRGLDAVDVRSGGRIGESRRPFPSRRRSHRSGITAGRSHRCERTTGRSTHRGVDWHRRRLRSRPSALFPQLPLTLLAVQLVSHALLTLTLLTLTLLSHTLLALALTLLTIALLPLTLLPLTLLTFSLFTLTLFTLPLFTFTLLPLTLLTLLRVNCRLRWERRVVAMTLVPTQPHPITISIPVTITVTVWDAAIVAISVSPTIVDPLIPCVPTPVAGTSIVIVAPAASEVVATSTINVAIVDPSAWRQGGVCTARRRPVSSVCTCTNTSRHTRHPKVNPDALAHSPSLLPHPNTCTKIHTNIHKHIQANTHKHTRAKYMHTPRASAPI